VCPRIDCGHATHFTLAQYRNRWDVVLRLIHERHGWLVLSGDTQQHGAVEASDALLAIERHAGVRPIELHKIRRQDPALGRDVEERNRIRMYRKAVEAAAAGKLSNSFERLDKMGAIPVSVSAVSANGRADQQCAGDQRELFRAVVKSSHLADLNTSGQFAFADSWPHSTRSQQSQRVRFPGNCRQRNRQPSAVNSTSTNQL
jgi:hypothetical protein